MADNRLHNIYEKMLGRYGPQHWWPGDTPFEITIGAILTQNTAWTNVEKAIANLKKSDVLSAAALRNMPEQELAKLIRPSGYYNVKTIKLKTFVKWLGERCGDNLDKLFQTETWALRRELLGLYGIGQETADSMLLYAGNHPVFVVDTYTKRIFSRIGLIPAGASYEQVQAMFLSSLPQDYRLFNEYHALIVRHGKETCRKAPNCQGCCLSDVSGTFEQNSGIYPCSGG